MYTDAELKEAGLDDFRVFLAQAWDFIGLPEPTPVQYRMAWYLQNGPKKEVIQAFRGVGKSWVTVAYAVFCLFRNPQDKIMMVSASQTLADDNAQFAHKLIKNWPLVKFLRPGKDDRDSALSFDVGPAEPAKSPSLKSAGVTGQITGSRADLIISDDVEIPDNSYTHHRRTKLAERVKEYSDILKPGGRIVYLGTPQVEQTLYRKLEDRGFETRIWPAQVPEDVSKYRGNLAPYIHEMIEEGAEPGDPVDPKRFDLQTLAEKRANHGRTRYALQFQLDTTLADKERHPLKLRDMIVTDLDEELCPVKLVWGSEDVIEDLPAGGFDGDPYVRPAWVSDEMVPYQMTVMAIDPSGQGQDECGYAIVRYCNGYLFLVDVGGFRKGYDTETLKALAGKAARYNVNHYVTEPNYGGGMFDKVLRPYMMDLAPNSSQDREFDAWATGKKEWRILDTLEPVVHSHRLVVDRQVIKRDLAQQEEKSKYSFIYQYSRMARQKDCLPHEDRLEALALAVSYFTDRMDAFTRDAQEAVEDHRAKMMEEELENWHEGVQLPVSQDRGDLLSRRKNKNWTGSRRR